jgi:hypothetical protein
VDDALDRTALSHTATCRHVRAESVLPPTPDVVQHDLQVTSGWEQTLGARPLTASQSELSETCVSLHCAARESFDPRGAEARASTPNIRLHATRFVLAVRILLPIKGAELDILTLPGTKNGRDQDVRCLHDARAGRDRQRVSCW